jgi:hypothetical protein
MRVIFSLVTTGLDPVVHADVPRIKQSRRISANQRPAWIAGSSPAMTTWKLVLATHFGARVLLHHHDHEKDSPPATKREAKRRKAHANHCRVVQTSVREPALLTCRAAARHSRRRARLPALLPRLLSETVTSLTQLQAMLPGTWTVRDPDKPALGLDARVDTGFP